VETPNNAERQRLSGHVQTEALRYGGRVTSLSVNGFGSDNLPYYLLRLTVVSRGRDLEPRGRKPASSAGLPDYIR
jgi:hypothetical protein